MSSDDDAREEIAQRLERQADRYRNASREAEAQEAEEAAAGVRGAASLADAQSIEAALGASRETGFFKRWWRRLTGGRRSSDRDNEWDDS